MKLVKLVKYSIQALFALSLSILFTVYHVMLLSYEFLSPFNFLVAFIDFAIERRGM